MPFAEFQPGNAGLALADFSLRSQDAYASLMDRAQRRKLAEQDMEMKKQEFANNLATSALQQDSLRAEIGIRRAQLTETERKAKDLAGLREEFNKVSGDIGTSLDEIQRQRDPFQQRRLLNQLQSQAARFYRDPELKSVLEKQFSAVHDTVAANESVNIAQAVASNLVAPNEQVARDKFPGRQLRFATDPSTGASLFIATDKPDPVMESRAMAVLSLADNEDALTEAIKDPTVNTMLGVPGSRVSELYRVQRAKLVTERQKDEETGVKDLSARAKGAEDLRERSVPGFEGTAPTKEEAIKFRDLTSNNDQILSGVREIARLSAQSGSAVDPKIRARIETVQNFLVGKLRLPMTGPGAFTDDERKFVRNTIGNPATIFSLSSVERTKLEELITRLTGDIDTTAAGLGLRRKQANNAPVNGSRAQALARGASGRP
jgi:hypothetical protein